MVMGYQAYAGNGLLDGITTGVGLRQKYDDMKRQRGLATGMRKIAEGDESGWADVYENAPEMYLKKQQIDADNARLKWDQEHKNDLTPYQSAMLSLKQQEIEQNKNSGQNLTPYERTVQMEQAKNDIEVARGEQDFQKMRPAVQGALNRAKDSLASGSGIGPLGGRLTSIGFNPIGKAAENYANVESANTQMNQLLRAKLKATGLTGSELNSAVEANAYRYTISPTDNEKVVLQKIKNFETDILGAGQQEPQDKQDDPLGIL